VVRHAHGAFVCGRAQTRRLALSPERNRPVRFARRCEPTRGSTLIR
jgi:hypothetical protein